MGTGLTETALQGTTGLSLSMFHEAMPVLLAAGQVVSQRDGRRNQTTYPLVQVRFDRRVQEGPLSPLAGAVLSGLGRQAENALVLAKRLSLDVRPVQAALDELETFGRVRRSQVGMLVIYRTTEGGETRLGWTWPESHELQQRFGE